MEYDRQKIIRGGKTCKKRRINKKGYKLFTAVIDQARRQPTILVA